MSELEQAAAVMDKIKEIDQQIKSFEDMRNFAIKHCDEEGKRIWSDRLRELKRERHIFLLPGSSYKVRRIFETITIYSTTN